MRSRGRQFHGRASTRDQGQTAQDQERTLSQVRQLGAIQMSALPGVRELRPGPGAEEAARRGGCAHVRSRQQAGGWPGARALASFLPDSEEGRRRPRAHRPWLCETNPLGGRPSLPSSAHHVSVYEFPSIDEEAREAVDEALAFSGTRGMDISPTMLTSLHMVVKSVDGTAPTLVTVADFPPEGVVPHVCGRRDRGRGDRHGDRQGSCARTAGSTRSRWP